MKKNYEYLTYCIAAALLLFVTACNGNKPAEDKEEASNETTSEYVETAKDIKGEEITYEADGISMNGFIAYDANQQGPRPGILVVHLFSV